jgi:hypothetical protein
MLVDDPSDLPSQAHGRGVAVMKNLAMLIATIIIAGCATCQAQNGRVEDDGRGRDILSTLGRIMNGGTVTRYYPCYAIADNAYLGEFTPELCERLATDHANQRRYEIEATSREAAKRAEGLRAFRESSKKTIEELRKAAREKPNETMSCGIDEWRFWTTKRFVPHCWKNPSSSEAKMRPSRDSRSLTNAPSISRRRFLEKTGQPT